MVGRFRTAQIGQCDLDASGLKFTWTWTWEHEREKLMGECPDGPGHSFFGTNLPFWTLDIGDTELALEL